MNGPTTQKKVKELSEKELAVLADDFLKGETQLWELKGMTREDVEAIYTIGYTMYANGRYKDASNVFLVLTFLDSMNGMYWKALAASRQMTKEFQLALTAYLMALSLDPQDVTLLMHIAECFMSLEEPVEAENMFNRAIQVFGDEPSYKAYKEQAQELIRFLKHEVIA